MTKPEADPRYSTQEGCLELAAEFRDKGRQALLEAGRCDGWARALEARASNMRERDARVAAGLPASTKEWLMLEADKIRRSV